ncbi:Potassium voltage-gated channel subfamily KQT; possible potassium channel, VIC family [hydrothermal vent metagenome]|uniref:Potassium voltage-gated channel subfamily KQT possible potassium channel, VIC family n=1 Tax=hydrothermal vent metagenome TaxID=652676 RepID=A0A3B0WHA9_9ZZZZ
MNLRIRTAQILERDSSDNRTGYWINLALIVLILLNVAAVILESEKQLSLLYHKEFWYFEVFSVIIFTVEYIARVWSCIDMPESKDQSAFIGRLRYMMTPLALIDILAILPFFLSLYFVIDLRFLRALRLLRLFKLTRYSPALNALLDVIKKESSALVAAFIVLLVMLVIAASGIHLLEGHVQKEAFGSIPRAMWWAIVTLSTVGYGDVTPVTAGGQIFGGAISLIGIGMFALPAAIMANGFAQNLKQRKQKYNTFIKHILADGKFDQNERWELEELRKELGLKPDEALHLLDTMFRKAKTEALATGECPHCGKDLIIEEE